MPYPFWDVGVGYGILMAVLAVVHVFVSHFAIGGGLYLVIAEGSARKAGDERRLEFVRRLSKFFILTTVVFGALTGVGIWFIIGLLNPKATEVLIHNFVWGWAIEWTFFVIEILAAILYFYGWKRMSAKGHMTLGWIYFGAAWLSLVVINGIITFMLTPGAWLETETGQGFWAGFLNPTYWPTTVLRTGICLLCAGLFALFVASQYDSSKWKASLIRYNARWAAAGLLVITVSWFWYRAAIPAEVLSAAKELTIPATSLSLLQILSYVMIAAVVVLGFFVPKAYVAPVGVLMLALGLAWFGAFEWFRESARKPYVIYDYMYGNAVRVDDVKAWQKDGLLTHAAFTTDDPGADIFRLSCRHCHTLDGYNPVKPAIDHTDATWIAGAVLNAEQMRWHMPPFPGTPAEAKILGDWLWERANQRPLADATGLEGTEFGAAVWEKRCSSCHVFGGHNDKSKQLATYDADDLQGLLEDEEGLEGMPVFTEMPEKETQALIEWLTAEGRLGGGE